jgi:hypothetical protein
MLDLDRLQILGRGVVQPPHIARREAELDAGCQPHDHPVTASVIMRTRRARTTHAGISPCLGRFEVFGGQISHGNASMRPAAHHDGR